MNEKNLISGFTFRSAFDLRQRVIIDGDETIKATITAAMFVDGSHSLRCEYVHNGSPQAPWIEHWRLTLCS